MASEQQKDTPMADVPEGRGTPSASEPIDPAMLSDKEKQVLALYDQLLSVRLEVALLTARKAYTGDGDQPNEDTAGAQKRLLEARAAYVLRNKVVDTVLSVYPVLRAVHDATMASPIERDLLPVVEQRDAASQAVAREAAARRAALDERTAVAAERLRLERQNAQLAAQLRELVAAHDRAEQEADGTDSDDEYAEALAQAKADVKTSRQRWRLVKGTTSAIVAGSGVDWTRDAALRDLVLDPE